MLTTTENRAYSRSPVDARIELRLINGILVEGDAVDISLRGLRFVTEHRLPIGKPVYITMILDDGHDRQRLHLDAHVARLDDDSVAVTFSRLNDDSARLLRRVVLYNAPDADRAREEFSGRPEAQPKH